MRKPKKAERQSSVLTRVFGGDDVSSSAVHDEFGIGNIHEPHPDDLLGGFDFGGSADSNANGTTHTQGTGDVFDGFDEMFTGATSNPQSPLKAPAAQTSMHDSVDSFSMFMSGDSSQPTTEEVQGGGGQGRKKNSQSLDDQMDSVFNAPSYQHQNAQSQAAPVARQSQAKETRSPQRSPNVKPMNEEDKKRAATMQLSEAAQARAQARAAEEMRKIKDEEKKAERALAERVHWKDTHEA